MACTHHPPRPRTAPIRTGPHRGPAKRATEARTIPRLSAQPRARRLTGHSSSPRPAAPELTLRKTVAALFVTLVAMLGIWVPSVSAAYVSNAKVVIIVGAVHGQTDSYRERGDAAYAEAKKYTPNVTKVYSPNATWSKVKSATTNANIVIYMGHGNGWPSPYTVRPELHDQGRLRAQRDRRATATTTSSTTASRTSTTWISPRTRSSCSTTCATPRATASRATPSRPSRPPSSGRRTTPPASSARRPVPSSPTATWARRTTCGACSRPTSRSSRSGGTRRTTTATSSASRRRATPGGPCTWTRTRRRRASTARSS